MDCVFKILTRRDESKWHSRKWNKLNKGIEAVSFCQWVRFVSYESNAKLE